jgi:hypothetical protein
MQWLRALIKPSRAPKARDIARLKAAGEATTEIEFKVQYPETGAWQAYIVRNSHSCNTVSTNVVIIHWIYFISSIDMIGTVIVISQSTSSAGFKPTTVPASLISTPMSTPPS